MKGGPWSTVWCTRVATCGAGRGMCALVCFNEARGAFQTPLATRDHATACQAAHARVGHFPPPAPASASSSTAGVAPAAVPAKAATGSTLGRRVWVPLPSKATLRPEVSNLNDWRTRSCACRCTVYCSVFLMHLGRRGGMSSHSTAEAMPGVPGSQVCQAAHASPCNA
jgi:hypothetical protein